MAQPFDSSSSWGTSLHCVIFLTGVVAASSRSSADSVTLAVKRWERKQKVKELCTKERSKRALGGRGSLTYPNPCNDSGTILIILNKLTCQKILTFVRSIDATDHSTGARDQGSLSKDGPIFSSFLLELYAGELIGGEWSLTFTISSFYPRYVYVVAVSVGVTYDFEATLSERIFGTAAG